MKYNKFKWAGLLLVTLFMTSCTYDANYRAHVIAHRAAYEATRPELEHYINLDTTLSDEDKLSYKGRLDAEDETITSAEVLLGIKK